jgi:ribosomal protein L37AE/L43A
VTGFNDPFGGTGGFGFGGGGQTIRIDFGPMPQQVPRNPPCVVCRNPGTQRLGQLDWHCDTCARIAVIRLAFIALFQQTPRNLHDSLYKRLALVYHPDAGCSDPVFMELLNAAKEAVK